MGLGLENTSGRGCRRRGEDCNVKKRAGEREDNGSSVTSHNPSSTDCTSAQPPCWTTLHTSCLCCVRGRVE